MSCGLESDRFNLTPYQDTIINAVQKPELIHQFLETIVSITGLPYINAFTHVVSPMIKSGQLLLSPDRLIQASNPKNVKSDA